jgi:energy-converting hydrogenase A subunit R
VKRIFLSDCEGPISKNDNAFEAAAHFIPNGDKLFSIISKYDDVLAGIVKKPSYNAGDTLKLVLPFFKAYDVTDEKLRRFSAETLVLISGTKPMLEQVKHTADSFIVSTSYEHYIRALCNAVAFPYENTYCTKLSLETYQLPMKEKTRLQELAKELIGMPMITIPASVKSLKDFSEQNQNTIKRLDEFFWKEISNMTAGRIFRDVTPVGGREKAEAIKDAVKKAKVQLSDVLYVGDSITDVQAFQLAKEQGGLAVSFNGNQYAIRNAEVAVLSENNLVTAVIAQLWCRFEKTRVLQILENWNHETLRQVSLDKVILEKLFALYPNVLPKVQIVTKTNMEALIRESGEFRKKVRGEAVGKLG